MLAANSQQFDAIICNPPFHQGFNIEGALTENFSMPAGGC